MSEILSARWAATVSASLLGIVDLAKRHQNFRRHLFVQLHILLELRHDRTAERFKLTRIAVHLRLDLGIRLGRTSDCRQSPLILARLPSFDQHLHGAVGQLQQLQHAGNRANTINVIDARIILTGILLRDQQDLLVVAHHLFERADRFFAADKQRHDHMREYHDVTKRKNREQRCLGLINHHVSPKTRFSMNRLVITGFDKRRNQSEWAATVQQIILAANGLHKPSFNLLTDR